MQTQALLNGLYLVAYLIAARWCVARLPGTIRQMSFAALNLAGLFYFICDYKTGPFLVYWLVVSLLYLPFQKNLWLTGRMTWPAFAAPLLVLAALRYLVPNWAATSSHSRLFMLVGFSYLAFRCSRLSLEIRNGTAPRPGYWEYLNFAFFLPTMFVGPINTYTGYRQAFAASPIPIPVFRAASRILIGLVKFYFIGGILGYLGYHPLLLNGNFHPWIHLPIVMVAYYLFLYCNFSGFCDMAIGAAGIIGIPVPENFDNPFAARNVKDFWNRWHITLSIWMRDVVFSPLSKYLVRKFGIARADHAIALTIVIVFLLVGIWHGVGWNFAAYGAAHALGVVTNHYYTIWLKKRLGREKFKAYNENQLIRAVAVGLTFCYCGASLIFFANTFPQIKEILNSLY
jgi:D-alanyl-lipoteichoic acid acyltransferase DltB (MBOAT superfamily)